MRTMQSMDEEMKILENRRLAQDVYLLALEAPAFDRNILPGCFVQVGIPSALQLLRRPLSIHRIDEGKLYLIYKVVGEGTKLLSQLPIGQRIKVFGPLGKGFPLPNQPAQRCLLIGGGVGVPPLYELARQLLGRGHEVQLFAGFRSATDDFATEAFADLNVNLRLTTEDGSLGSQGYVTSVLPSPQEIDVYYACGPLPFLHQVETTMGSKRKGYLSFEARMACGLGACYGCVIQTKEGLKRVCADGPVFPAGEVLYGGI